MKCSLMILLTVAMSAIAVTPGFSQTNKMNATELEKKTNPTESAYFGGGCFWCVEAAFEMVPGVKSVTSGYAGGKTENPTYQQVCSGGTGHAEVTKIEFDPGRVSYDRLLEVFWEAHDPTTLNRQGADEGTQYRSVILYASEAQKAAAEKSKKETAGKFRDPIVTEIVPLTKFYPAENYHQDYFRNNPDAPYCQAVIRPKLEKLKEKIGKFPQ
jgi:peptide-methionine (S)-S-oxide reductase